MLVGSAIVKDGPEGKARSSLGFFDCLGSTMEIGAKGNQAEGRSMRIGRIISGGQTGVDRAALDFAVSRGIEHGGWVPKGRRAEDGPVAPIYNLTETETRRYAGRTRNNVLDSDGTLIICEGRLSGGTALARSTALKAGRPLFVIDMSETAMADAAEAIRLWMGENAISVLNVAGPRESQRPGIYERTRALLEQTFERP